MFVKFFHFILLSVALFSTGSLFYRYYAVKKLTGKVPGHLKHWGVALLLFSLAVSFFLLWDFYPNNPNIFYTRSLFPWIIISGLLILIFSTSRLIRGLKIYWEAYQIFFFLFIITTFYLIFYFISKNATPTFFLKKDIIVPFVFIAPLEILSAFMTLFWAVLTIGKYFTRFRMLGFLFISLALIGLAALNLSRPWYEAATAYWELEHFYHQDFLTSTWVYIRESLYFLFFIGSYLATLPRFIKRDHHNEMVMDGQNSS